MELEELDLGVRVNGRVAVPLEVEVVRELAPADLTLLGQERGIKPSPIGKLGDRHHSLARCLAEGMKPAEASAVTGYSISRISILKSDPTFKELQEFYREHKDAQFAEFGRRAAMVALTALNNLQEQLEDEENPPSLAQNLEVVTKLADRTGHAPKTGMAQVQVNVGLGSAMASARARLAQRALASAQEPVEAEFEVVGEPGEQRSANG